MRRSPILAGSSARAFVEAVFGRPMSLRGLRRPMKPEPNARSLQRNHAGVPESRKSLWNPPEARVFSMTALDEQDRLVPADGFRSALQGRSLMALNIDFHEVDWVMLGAERINGHERH